MAKIIDLMREQALGPKWLDKKKEQKHMFQGHETSSLSEFPTIIL